MSLTDSLLINVGSLQSSGLLICMTLSSSYSSCSAFEMCEIAEISEDFLNMGKKKSHFDKWYVHSYPFKYMSYMHTKPEIRAGRYMGMGLSFPLATQN